MVTLDIHKQRWVNFPLIFRWQLLAKYVYSSPGNMIRARNEHYLAAKFGIRSLREQRRPFKSSKSGDNDPYNTISIFGTSYTENTIQTQ